MNPNEYLQKFFAELERLVDGHGTRHAISTVQAAQAVADSNTYFPTSI